MRIKITGVEEVEVEPGLSIEDLLPSLDSGLPEKVLAARMNGRLVDLTAPVEEGDLELLTWEDEEGKEV